MTKREGEFLKEVILEQLELPKAVKAGIVAMVKGCTKDWGSQPSSFALAISRVLWGQSGFCDPMPEHHFCLLSSPAASCNLAPKNSAIPLFSVAACDLGARFLLNGMWCNARG